MMLLLSPLLKLGITWNAECLEDEDEESIWSDCKDSLSDNGEGSMTEFKFKLRLGTWGAGK